MEMQSAKSKEERFSKMHDLVSLTNKLQDKRKMWEETYRLRDP